jgi:cytochrome c-type biogenesis protein CcmH
MLWFLFGVMCFGAVIFTIWPFLRSNSRNFVAVGSAVVFVVVLSAGLYTQIGSPGTPSVGAGQPAAEMDETIAALAARLEREPEDINGWRMLGRSYMAMGNHAGAVAAFERVVELEDAQNAQGLVDLGEAMLAQSGQVMTPKTLSLFENALALEPNNPAALFWSGLGAANRGDTKLAIDRWERLLGTNPPPEIRDIIAQRIAEWKGETPPVTAAPAAVSTPPPAAEPGPGAVVSATIALSAAAAASLPAEAVVFVIARDPAAPVPPIAVARRQLSELPAVVELGDRESMVPGRELSGFPEFELIARVSLSGTPASRPGDWFGSAIVRPSENGAISLAIDTQVQ